MSAPSAPWLARDHALLVETVRDAGALAMRYFGQQVKQWEKHPGDPVSKADHAVNDYLMKTLLDARPGYGWLSEESEDDPARLVAKRLWVVDPIDGTRAFLKHKPEFTVCVALVADGAPLAGAVFNPAVDEMFEAVKGGGARLNGAPIRMGDHPGSGPMHLLASRRTFERHHRLKELGEATFSAINSIAYRLTLVAAGRYDATLSLAAKSDWDIAAADVVVREAGGVMTDGAGEPFIYNRPSVRHPSVLAAAPALHRRLLELMGEG